MKIQLPKISIVIPVYNVENYITECLQSVMRQTYSGEMECILVDDCGKDNSIVIAERILSTYNGAITFQIVHRTQNGGLSAARNSGTKVATGEYIYYLDSDDYMSDDCLSVLTAPLQNSKYEMIIGDYETFGDYQVQSLLFERQNELLGNENIFHELSERQLPVTAWNKLCSRSFLTGNGIDFLEGQLHEDDLWTYKICMCATKIAIQKHVTYFYRQRNNSIVYDTKIKSKQRFESVYKTVDYILNHHGAVNPSDYERCALTYIGKCLSYVIDGDFGFYQEYKAIRKQFKYSPCRLFFSRKISPLEFKRAFHYTLPPILGYWYFLLRRMKAHL